MERAKMRPPGVDKSKEAEDTAALRNRLVVPNDRRVSTLTSKFFNFIRAAESDATTLEEVELVEGQLQKEFDMFGISLGKLDATATANARELQQYHSLHQQREHQIVRARDDLVHLKTELEHQQRRRRHKEEYEAIGRVINQLPSRAATQTKLQTLEGELAALANEQQQLEALTQKRQKQFALLFDCIDDLQRALRAEEKEEDEREESPMQDDEARREPAAATTTTGKRKRTTLEQPATPDDAAAGVLGQLDEAPAAETARKRVREVEEPREQNETPSSSSSSSTAAAPAGLTGAPPQPNSSSSSSSSSAAPSTSTTIATKEVTMADATS